MFSFHARSRSLIPVSAIKDYEKSEIYIVEELEDYEEEQDVEIEQAPRQHTTQHVLVYLLFLADAIMQSSLTSQIDALLPTASDCPTMETSFLRSIMQCAYYFGASAGLIWGMAADKFGRRRIAILSLFGSLICCLSMGFARSFGAFALLRYFAGVFGSAAPIAGLAALADLTHGSNQRSYVIARLPLVVVCGQIGPFLSGAIKHFAQDHFEGVFIDYPALGGQAACGFLVLTIAIAECLFLKETLPTMVSNNIHNNEEYIDCEKASFLGQSFQNDSEDSLSISIVDSPKDDTSSPLPSHISISQMLTAPSVLLLLASFSALSLHSTTFDVLLPHLGQHTTQNIGLGLPCQLLQPILLVVKLVAASSMLFIPTLVKNIGLARLYRGISITFPALYILLPALALLTTTCGTDSDILAGAFSTLATLLKTTLTSAAQVLVLLLALSITPDAASTGTLIGVISLSEIFKALAVGIAGVSYFLSDEYSVLVVNAALWSVLAVIAALGAVITRRMRETSRVGADLPAECLVWEGMFDVDSEDENGF